MLRTIPNSRLVVPVPELAWVLLVIIAAFTAIAFWTSKYWVHYEGERG